MTETDVKPGQIFQLIPKVMADIGAVGKGRKNEQQGYRFRGIDDLLNAAQPVLVQYGVFIVPNIVKHEREERQTKNGGTLRYSILTVAFRFYAPDGSFFEATTVGEAMDSGDKASNKAMSAALKYVLIDVFCIPTEGDNDTENKSPDLAARNNQQQRSPQQQRPLQNNGRQQQQPNRQQNTQQPSNQKPASGNSGDPLATIRREDETFLEAWDIAIQNENGFDCPTGRDVLRSVMRKHGRHSLAECNEDWRQDLVAAAEAGKFKGIRSNKTAAAGAA